MLSANDVLSEISDDFEEEHEMDPARQLVRKRLRKVFYASYFIGVAISLQNRIRLYGTLKPIAEAKNFENEVKTTKENSFLV